MRIKRVVEADFRWSDLGIWEKFSSTHGEVISSLSRSDVVVFISKKGNQLLFIHGFDEADDRFGNRRQVLSSTRFRVVSGTWSPYMLVNYARAAGVKIDGLKTFEEHFGYLTKGG